MIYESSINDNRMKGFLTRLKSNTHMTFDGHTGACLKISGGQKNKMCQTVDSRIYCLALGTRLILIKFSVLHLLQ